LLDLIFWQCSHARFFRHVKLEGMGPVDIFDQSLLAKQLRPLNTLVDLCTRLRSVEVQYKLGTPLSPSTHLLRTVCEAPGLQRASRSCGAFPFDLIFRSPTLAKLWETFLALNPKEVDSTAEDLTACLNEEVHKLIQAPDHPEETAFIGPAVALLCSFEAGLNGRKSGLEPEPSDDVLDDDASGNIYDPVRYNKLRTLTGPTFAFRELGNSQHQSHRDWLDHFLNFEMCEIMQVVKKYRRS